MGLIVQRLVSDGDDLFACSCSVKKRKARVPKSPFACYCKEYKTASAAPRKTKKRLSKKARWATKADVARWKKAHRRTRKAR